MKKRDRLAVIYDLLKVVRDNNNSIKPTPLLRYSNLSSQRFSEYLRELKEKEFLKEIVVKGRKFYTLTDKGFEYLAKYAVIIEFIDEFDL